MLAREPRSGRSEGYVPSISSCSNPAFRPSDLISYPDALRWEIASSVRGHSIGERGRSNRIETLGLVEKFIEFAWHELAPAIRNANLVAGCFELPGFGDGDH